MPMGVYLTIFLVIKGYVVHIGVGSFALLVPTGWAISGPQFVERAMASLHVFISVSFWFVFVVLALRVYILIINTQTEMKKKVNYVRFYFFCLITIFFLGCSSGNTVDVSKLVAERDSLKESLSVIQKENDNLSTFMQVVSEGLDSIAIQEGFIRDGGPEGTGMTPSQMKKSLEELADMLARQRERIAALEDSLSLGTNGSQELHNIVSYLNEQLTAKENTINQLREEISSKNYSLAQMQKKVSILYESVDSLKDVSNKKDTILVLQSDMMNTCYIQIGTKKDLKQAGFLNGSKLNPNALTPDNCLKVDITTFEEVQLQSKKPKILTSLPPRNSYRIVTNTDGTSTLYIDDATLFWSISNYLVIQL